jgi:hypothetical protein
MHYKKAKFLAFTSSIYARSGLGVVERAVPQVMSAQPLGNDLLCKIQMQGVPVLRRAVCETLVGVERNARVSKRER